MASFALVSKYGIPFFDVHHPWARFVDTFNQITLIRTTFTLIRTKFTPKKYLQFEMEKNSPLDSPSQPCYQWPRRGNSPDPWERLGSRTRPSMHPEIWKSWVLWRHTPGHSSQLHGRKPLLGIGTSPVQLYPRSAWWPVYHPQRPPWSRNPLQSSPCTDYWTSCSHIGSWVKSSQHYHTKEGMQR